MEASFESQNAKDYKLDELHSLSARGMEATCRHLEDDMPQVNGDDHPHYLRHGEGLD